MGGIRLRHLAFTGPEIETAELTFDDGLNIIYGASNTGKSFTAEAILFMLGVNKTLRETEEVVPYDGVWLGLTFARTEATSRSIDRPRAAPSSCTRGW